MTMIEQTKSTEQLRHEIVTLQQENQKLSAQLAFHRRVFREVHLAIGAAGELNESMAKNEAVRKLLEENEQLKNQLKLFRLSEREKEVLRLIVQGYTSKEIGEKLSISKLTVDTHRKHIQQKLGVSKMADVIKMAMQTDLT